MNEQSTDVYTLLGISQALHAAASPATPTKEKSPPLPPVELSMTREEYIRRQHEIFEQLRCPPNVAIEHNPDLRDMLEVYMASLDEQIYNEVELQQQVIERAAHISHSNLELLLNYHDETDKYTYIVEKLAQMGAVLSTLEADYSDMAVQRDQLDEARLDLKHKYAAELARRIRLDHMVKVLTQKVVDQDRDLGAQRSQHEKELESLRREVRELRSKVDQTPQIPAETLEEFEKAELDEKLTMLYTETLKLQVTERETPKTPEKMLSQVLVHLESARSKRAQQTKELVRSIVDQHETKEREWTLRTAKLEVERDIYLAKATSLEEKLKEKADEIQGLIDRSVSLILTDKQLRSQLVSQNDILKRYEMVIESTRTHLDKLTKENVALADENEGLASSSTASASTTSSATNSGRSPQGTT